MLNRKYLNDYRLTESVNEKGRVIRQTVYVGSYHRMKDGARATASAKLLLALCVPAWAACIAALAFQSAASKIFYVLLPFAFVPLSLGYLTAAIILILRRREPLIRSDADKIASRYPISAIFTVILSAVPLIGEGISALTAPETMLPGDAVFSAGAALICAFAVFALLRRSAFTILPE